MTQRAGTTGLVVRVPEAEPAVRAWRDRHDPSARAGVPAHVTVLFPFLDESRIDAAVRAELAATFARFDACDLRFTRCGRFPGVLYLAPEPDEALRHLTQAVAARWPEAPPYGGAFADVVPHLTVADGPQDEALDAIEARLLPALPVTTRLASVELIAYDGAKWHVRASFPLGGAAPGTQYD